jgi:hypothetical protein
MGLFSLVGSLIGSGSAKRQSRKAEAASIAGMEKGIAETRRQFDVTQGNFKPWLDAGTQALGAQGNLVGLNGNDAQQAAITSLRASPLYQSLFRNGEEALLQNASATGSMRGGNMQRGLADFGADTLSTVIQQQLASLGGIAGQGYNSAGALGQFGAQASSDVASLYGAQGAARAGGLLQRGAINMQNWKNIGSFADQAAQAAAGAYGGMLPPGAQQMMGKIF